MPFFSLSSPFLSRLGSLFLSSQHPPPSPPLPHSHYPSAPTQRKRKLDELTVYLGGRDLGLHRKCHVRGEMRYLAERNFRAGRENVENRLSLWSWSWFDPHAHTISLSHTPPPPRLVWRRKNGRRRLSPNIHSPSPRLRRTNGHEKKKRGGGVNDWT